MKELILLDWDYRLAAKESPTPDDYLDQFPMFAWVVEETIEELVSAAEISGRSTRDDRNRLTKTHAIADSNSSDSSTQLDRFGQYELVSQIGRGGMGVVFRAVDTRLNRLVALKLILTGNSADEEELTRFRIEASSAASLDHPGIVPVYEYDMIDDRPFIAMAFIDGISLDAVLAKGPLSPAEAAEILLRVARAVEFAHHRGIVHRDLKPSNVLLARVSSHDPHPGDSVSLSTSEYAGHYQPKVVDFGLAKQLTGDDQVTLAGQVLGTPSFMSPEQAAGDSSRVGPEADIYSLGAMLYCLVTGRPPFQSASAAETLVQVLRDQPVSPRELNPSLPRDLEVIILKCLEKTMSSRYRTAGDFAADLTRSCRGEPIHARPLSLPRQFLRWYPRHASQILGAYYLVTPFTWVFFIIGEQLNQAATTTNPWRLAAPHFLPWAFCWMWLGYGIAKENTRLQLVNVAFILAFAGLAFFQNDRQSLALIIAITVVGGILQTGAFLLAGRARRISLSLQSIQRRFFSKAKSVDSP